jgi:endonuclease YncB( thermonuclease family)
VLQRGLARLLVIPPNGAYARTMLAEELAARRARRGLWGAC